MNEIYMVFNPITSAFVKIPAFILDSLLQVGFRNAVAGTNIANWYQVGDNVAFSRGDKGYFAMSKYGDFDMTLQTGEMSDFTRKITR